MRTIEVEIPDSAMAAIVQLDWALDGVGYFKKY